jgi:SAM-dependent methyltransferase
MGESDMADNSTSGKNSQFWDEMCGTNIARELGIKDASPESLKKFDDWFFDFYPYLFAHLEPVLATDGRVMEVGLGYGSVASYLMGNGIEYLGLDIAQGPVEMANLRCRYLGRSTTSAVIGDVLNLRDFECSSFGGAVAIGSLHHTGDFDTAINEIANVVRPDGVIVGMVYSLFSLRNWIRRPGLLVRELIRPSRPNGPRVLADEQLRWLSDYNSEGIAAPSTEYFSRRALRTVLEGYGTVEIRARNLDTLGFLGFSFPRLRLLMLKVGIDRFWGLDLYFVVKLGPTRE